MMVRAIGRQAPCVEFPASDLFRVVRDEDGLQVDFMSTLHGIRSFEGLRARAETVSFGEHKLLVASLSDIIRSKRAAGRARDLAVLEILEKTLDEQKKIASISRTGVKKKNGKGIG